MIGCENCGPVILGPVKTEIQGGIPVTVPIMENIFTPPKVQEKTVPNAAPLASTPATVAGGSVVSTPAPPTKAAETGPKLEAGDLISIEVNLSQQIQASVLDRRGVRESMAVAIQKEAKNSGVIIYIDPQDIKPLNPTVGNKCTAIEVANIEIASLIKPAGMDEYVLATENPHLVFWAVIILVSAVSIGLAVGMSAVAISIGISISRIRWNKQTKKGTETQTITYDPKTGEVLRVENKKTTEESTEPPGGPSLTFAAAVIVVLAVGSLIGIAIILNR